MIRTLLFCILGSCGAPVYAAETDDEFIAKLAAAPYPGESGMCVVTCQSVETIDEKIARLETELRLAKAERIVNRGIERAAKKRKQ